ncbi:MAG TPA: DUF1622 domain-containing protein [Clostridiaceae bacterium]|jgi:uncharacterized membrane protein|nr:DUF1622 domain-containing protein [Clostridiaceae bacterium]
MLEFLHHALRNLVQYGMLLMEMIGVCIVLVTGVRSVVGLFMHDEHIRLKLAQGLALALEFKLGGEVLRTVIVQEWSELLVLGAIILLRAALTFLIHWEIKNEEARLK